MSRAVYVIHPVTPDQKEALLRKGRIVDARFAPPGAVILTADGKPKNANLKK